VTPETARALLDAERRRTEQRLAQLRDDHRGFVDASRDTNADDEHDPEGTTIAFERSQVGALVRQADAHLHELEAAVERLMLGTYGVCERCGADLPDGRLEARPTARLCVACAAPR
jgi:DnaK suppressor protein